MSTLNDYVVNVGSTWDDLTPRATSDSKEEAIKIAKLYHECHKFRYKRHWKACQTCKYHECRANCNTCEINPRGSVLSCPCLSPDDSKKYARCKYYKPNTAEE